MEALLVRGKDTRASAGTWLCKTSHRPGEGGTGGSRARSSVWEEGECAGWAGEQGRPSSEHGKSVCRILGNAQQGRSCGWMVM